MDNWNSTTTNTVISNANTTITGNTTITSISIKRRKDRNYRAFLTEQEIKDRELGFDQVSHELN